MNTVADRFGQTMGMFLAHFTARIVPEPRIPEEPANGQPQKPPANKSANSKSAVQTRKARYGESKMKRGSREEAKKDRGFKMTKENK